MKRSLIRSTVALCLLALASAPAFGQGTATSSISGTVVDSGGGVIPGATVVVKNNATGGTFTVVTNAAGAFSVPALDAGIYTVTVSLTGFKSAVVNNVRLAIGTPASVKAVLEVGSLTETVEVRGGSELVNTQTPTIASTLNSDQINKLPVATRNLVNAVTFLPGVNTATTNRDSNFNGLPDSFVAISLDGVNNNENYNKSTEGLFAMVTPRPDAVEAVTVTTAGAGADIGGHGAVQIAFVTRSGTNRFSGSGYHYHRSPRLNTNYFFNEINELPKNDVVLNQYGGRQGGPIVIPGLYDGRGKAFFFFNYEELRLPNDFTRTRTVLQPGAQNGLFRWDAVSGGQTVIRERNVLELAAASGHLASPDPTVAQVLNAIAAATRQQGVLNDTANLNTRSYLWQSPGDQYEKQPVVKVDYNLTPRHRLSGTYNWQVVVRDPDHLNSADARFPGFANFRKYTSYRPLASGTLRSTLASNLVNELRGGARWGPSEFGGFESDAGNAPRTFADQGNLELTFPLSLTNAGNQNTPSAREVPTYNIDNTLNWQKGTHSLSLGGSLYLGKVWVDGQQMVPEIEFGVDSDDPADAMFTTANFPGASSGELDNASDLYALLVGRVNNIIGNIVLDAATNQYTYLGKRRQAGKMNEYSLFVQDAWRATPTLTINAGLRWDVQMPFSPDNNVMSTSTFADACGISGISNGQCNFFRPGASSGVYPTYVRYGQGTRGWRTDYNNLAPNIGVAWRPNAQSGFWRALLGDPDQATVRAGYSVNYAREGMQRFISQFGANPGSQVDADRNADTGLLIGPGQSYPVLLRDRGRLGPPPFTGLPAVRCDGGQCAPAYPIEARASRQDDINIFHPDLQVAFARSYTVSFQRALSRDMAVDVRYVGTRGVNQWTEENWNEINLIENGFFDEFRLAMANLRANQAAGRGNTFAYTGVPGTSPLPIYLAYFNGRSDAGNTSAYAGSNWSNSTFVGRLARQNPNPQSAAADLDNNSGRRANAIRAGLPANFFVVNPDVDDVQVWTSDAYSGYDAMQIEVRRRFSRGFQVNGSYQYALEYGSQFLGRHDGRVSSATPNVRHAFKMQWDWSVPVGRGRRFGANMHAVADAVLGGWEFNGAGRVQARSVDFGNVRLVGMTIDDLTKEYRHRYDPETKIVTMLPADIILNTRRAFSVDATSSTGYSSLGAPEGRYIAPANSDDCIQLKSGDCAPRRTMIRAPWFTRVDMSLAKRFRPGSRVNFELRLDVLNVFDNVNFDLDDTPGSGSGIFQVDTAYRDPSNTFDPGGRLGQIVWRINW
jgi:hypothetical protein